jgi:hypothetical protein
MSPEKCHYDQGSCREPQWGLDNCMQTHYVYLANSSGLKVGISRVNQIPTRWMDQGAIQAIPIFQVSSRYYSGVLETLYKQKVSDRTQWQTMLKGHVDKIDLLQQQQILYAFFSDQLVALENELASKSKEAVHCHGEQAIIHLDNQSILNINYPVLEYPKKVKSFNLDKHAQIEGTLMGIKGQYLILDTGVLNLRKFSGYHIAIKINE